MSSSLDVVGGALASSGIGRIGNLSTLYTFLGISTATSDELAIATIALRHAEGAVISYLGYDPVQAVRTEYYPEMDQSRLGDASIWEINSTSAYERRVASEVSEELQLLRLPVRQANSSGNQTLELYIDYDGRSGTKSGAFPADTQKTEGTDFWPNYDKTDADGKLVCSDGILRTQGLWPSVAGSVKVTYLAGYTDLEFQGVDPYIDATPIYNAVINEGVRRFKQAWSRRKGTACHATVAKTSESLGSYSYSSSGEIQGMLLGSSAEILPETALALEPFVNYGAKIAL